MDRLTALSVVEAVRNDIDTRDERIEDTDRQHYSDADRSQWQRERFALFAACTELEAIHDPADLELSTIMVLSTAHITKADCDSLSYDGDSPWDVPMTVSTFSPDGHTESMAKAISFAEKHGAAYVMFDRDGPVITSPDLDKHDW